MTGTQPAGTPDRKDPAAIAKLTPEGGLRYCISSAALRFVPVDELETQGCGDHRGLFTTKEA